MTAVPLPGTDLAVTPLVLGGNMLGSRLDEDASFALLDAYAESGGTMVDTAAVYADWLPVVERGCSELTIGRWLRTRPGPAVMVATKGGHPDLARPHEPRLDEAALRQDVGQSLDRLGLPALDLWLAHRDDPRLPVAEILGVFEALRTDGLMRWYGVSNWTTERVAEAVRLRDAGAAPGFVATQSAFAAAVPRADRMPADLVAADDAMLTLHATSGLALLAYSAAAKGWFAGAAGADDAYDSAPNRHVREVVRTVAAEIGAEPAQVALAALLGLDVPLRLVVGCSSVARWHQSLAAVALPLSPDQVHRIHVVLPVGVTSSAPDRGYAARPVTRGS
ncbi:MAG: aldo/keto reductase [Lapillicoccus sp.]